MVSPVKRQKQEEEQGEGREKAGEKLNDLAKQVLSSWKLEHNVSVGKQGKHSSSKPPKLIMTCNN